LEIVVVESVDQFGFEFAINLLSQYLIDAIFMKQWSFQLPISWYLLKWESILAMFPINSIFAILLISVVEMVCPKVSVSYIQHILNLAYFSSRNSASCKVVWQQFLSSDYIRCSICFQNSRISSLIVLVCWANGL